MGENGNDLLISVDIETDELNSERGAILSIGACLVNNPDETFYTELKRSSNPQDSVVPLYAGTGLNTGALQICVPGLSWYTPELHSRGFTDVKDWIHEVYTRVYAHGVDPIKGLYDLTCWVERLKEGHNKTPVMLSSPSTFDFAWLDTYFKKYTGVNPFGISGPCLKTIIQTRLGCSWGATRTKNLPGWLRDAANNEQPHNALADAQAQARMHTAVYNPRWSKR